MEVLQKHLYAVNLVAKGDATMPMMYLVGTGPEG